MTVVFDYPHFPKTSDMFMVTLELLWQLQILSGIVFCPNESTENCYFYTGSQMASNMAHKDGKESDQNLQDI